MGRLITLKPRLNGMPKGSVQPITPNVIQRKRGTTGVNDRKAIKARDFGMCQECKRNGLVTVGVVVDHITPLIDGGSDESDNKQLLCIPCHEDKTAHEAAERAKGRAG